MTTPAEEVAPPPPSRPRRGIRWWVGRLSGAVMAFLVLWLVAVWPPPIWYRWFWPRETAFMHLRRSTADQLAQHAQRRREAVQGQLPRLYRPVSIDQIDRDIQAAVLIGEDHRFFEHGGIDYQAVREAMGYRRDEFSWGNARDRSDLWRAVRRSWNRRNGVRGASTLTQQLAKNLYLSPSRNPLRKLKEAITAYRLEWAMGKRRLLELYLNVVELGPEIWGVEAASHYYFGRSARDLGRDQAAALAGTLPFPLASNPSYRAGRMRWRQQHIVGRMRGDPVRIPRDDEIPAALDPPDDR